jgi:uncharacterized protein YjbJ (UPF0337 family)
MNEDRIEGKMRTFGGKAEQLAGRATGDAKTRVEGVLDEATGRAQDLYGQAKDAASEAYDDLAEGAHSAEDFIRDFVETRPYTTAALALAAGWLIGRMGRHNA